MRSRLWAVAPAIAQLSFATAASGAATTGTYWQEDACTDHANWCVEWVRVGASEVEVRSRWRDERTRRPGDDGTRRVYAADGQGRRFDYVRASGAAAFGSRQRQQETRGSYFFPSQLAGTGPLALHDDGAIATIRDIALDEARRSPAGTYRDALRSLAGATAIQVDDFRRDRAREGRALRLARDADGGFSVEQNPDDAPQADVIVPDGLSHARLEPEQARAFFDALAASPLLREFHPPRPRSADDAPRIRITLTTAGGPLVFEGSESVVRNPWVYRAGGQTLVVPTDQPMQALRILRARADASATPAGDPDESARPLRMAAERGDMAALGRLVKRGDVNERTPYDGETALTAAVQWDRAEAVAFLLDHGADAALANGKRKTPVGLAAAGGNEVIIALFARQAASALPDDPTQAAQALEAAVESGSLSLVRALLPHVRMTSREWLLSIPIRQGDLEMLRLLMEPGTDLNRKRSRLPLHWAAQAGHADVIEFLLQSGADVRAAEHGRTALSFARVPAAAGVLVRAGSDVNARSGNGATPLLELTTGGGGGRLSEDPRRAPPRDDAVGTARVLLDAGADVGARNARGFTALQACLRGQPVTADRIALAVLLLERGADPDAPDPEGVAPIWRAIEHYPSQPRGATVETLKPLFAALVRAGAHDRPNASGVRPRQRATTLPTSAELLPLLEGLAP
jgi:ankyrin repeat protein